MPATNYPGAEIERTIRWLQLSQLLRSSCWPLTNPAGTAIAVALTNGDHARVVAMLSLGSTLSSGLELLIAPTLGIVADRWGRKPLLVATALARLPFYVSNLLRPSLFAIFMEALVDAVGFSVYTLGEQTILADMVTDARMLTVCSARVASAKGMAQMGSFLLGGTIAAMNPRLPFALAATACASAASVLVFGVPETGPGKPPEAAAVDCATDTNGADLEPKAAFVPLPAACGPRALLRSGRVLRLLTISAVLDGMVDKTFQIRAIHATQRVGMSAPLFGVFSAGRGFTSMCSGYATKVLLNITGGVQGFSTVSHACCVLQHALMALAARGGTTGVLLMFFALLPMTCTQ
jgi:MFS family permease